jgi:hypothetical protein
VGPTKGISVRKNTHLSPDKYLSDATLGLSLSKEMDACATEALLDEPAKVVFFKEGDDDFGYEVRVGDEHEQIDGGYETLLDAVVAFTQWYDRQVGDEDEDDED